MAAIANAIDAILQAAIVRLEPTTLPSNTTVDFALINGATRPADYADVTTTILSASGTSILMNNAQLFKSGTGLGGVFIGSGGLVGRNSGGSETFAIDAGTGASRFAGDIDTQGKGRFRGAYSGADGQAAVYANESGAALSAVIGTSNSNDYAFKGFNSYSGPSFGGGVLGYVNRGVAIDGYTYHVTGIGVLATNAAGGVALSVVGKMELNNSTFKWGSYTYTYPIGSGVNFLRDDGAWGSPVTTASVNAAFGVSQSGVCQLVATDSGSASVAGSGLNLNCAIPGYRFRASGNSIVLEAI